MIEHIVQLTKELVAIPSVSNDIQQLHAVIDHIASEFKNHPSARIKKIIHNEKPSLVVANFDGKRWDICLNGHVDVVPASEQWQWETSEKDGKLYGRWTVDMKAAVSVMIFVMKKVLDDDIDKKVSLMLTADEELGWVDGAKHLAELWYGGDVMLIPDSPWLQDITIASKGIYSIHIDVQGTAGHSAYPRLATNAIEKAVSMYRELQDTIQETVELAQDDHRWTSVQLTSLHAGKAHNAIPGSAACIINIRHTESYSQTLLQNMSKHIIQKYDGEIVKEKYGAMVSTPVDHLALQLYKRLSDEINWWDLWFSKAHGATDAKHFAEKWAITILHGPNWAHLHGAGEYVEIASIQKLYDLSLQFVLEYDA